MIRLSGYTRENRFSVTARVKDALLAAGGWIVDHHQFSNLSLAIQFEIEGKDVSKLAAALADTGLTLSAESVEALRRAYKGTVMGSLQATFLHNDPDERVAGPLG